MTIWKRVEPINDYFDFDNIQEKLRCIYGVKNLDEWLNPDEKYAHDPLLLDNIVQVAERIVKAIKNNEKICVSGDPDVDGCNSLAIMVRYLKHFTNNVVYTYNQRSEGHGIINQIVDEDADLLIILDSSTNQTDACRDLKCDGVDIIIIDHHEKNQDNPHALIVNNQMDNYPNKFLSGSGLTYKVCQVLDSFLGNKGLHKQYIDLTGIGIYADVMSLAEIENRYFVSQALKNVKNFGIKAMLEKSRVDLRDLNSNTIGYTIAPIINSCTRLDNIELIIELLLEDNYDKCLELAKEAISLNNKRKTITNKLFEKFKNKVDNSHSIIIVNAEKTAKGFNGLLATQIADKFQKPTLVVKDWRNDTLAGSARSIGSIKLKSILEKTGLLNFLEGHEQAFGLEFNEENIDKIYEVLDEELKNIEEDVIKYHIELDLNEVDFGLIKEIEKFNWLAGKDAEMTKVRINDLPIKSRKVMGKNKNTVKLETRNELSLIKFNTTENYMEDIEGCIVDVVGVLSINRWFNFSARKWVIDKQLLIEDLKIQ